MMVTLSCSDLSFSRGRVPILKHINFQAESSQLVGLIGHNGAGKSTLIKILLGLIKNYSGDVQVLNDTPGKQPLTVGYLPENVSFYDSMTIEEHLDYFSKLKGCASSRKNELIDRLGIGHVRKNKLAHCSKGQRQRLGLAQALLSEPKILFLDEPTVGLDPEASDLMYRDLMNLKQSGCTVVVCTHELSLIENFLDKAVVICAGEKKGDGDLPTLRRQAQLNSIITFSTVMYFIEEDPVLSRFRVGQTLSVPDSELETVVRVLTKQYECFGFQLKQAGLREIYSKLVGLRIQPQEVA